MYTHWLHQSLFGLLLFSGMVWVWGWFNSFRDDRECWSFTYYAKRDLMETVIGGTILFNGYRCFSTSLNCTCKELYLGGQFVCYFNSRIINIFVTAKFTFNFVIFSMYPVEKMADEFIHLNSFESFNYFCVQEIKKLFMKIQIKRNTSSFLKHLFWKIKYFSFCVKFGNYFLFA